MGLYPSGGKRGLLDIKLTGDLLGAVGGMGKLSWNSFGWGCHLWISLRPCSAVHRPDESDVVSHLDL